MSSDLMAWLRKAADEMRAEGQNGWPVTVDAAADRITELEAKVAALESERDEALEAEAEAKDCFWAVYPTYIEAKGHGISTEAARTELAARAEAAEAKLAEAEKDKAEAAEALEPFAEVADHFDADGIDLPDDAGVYANVAGDFRRARTTLSSLRSGHDT